MNIKIDTNFKYLNINIILTRIIFKQNQLKHQRTQNRKITCSNIVLKKKKNP